MNIIYPCHIFGIIIPTDFRIFQRGGFTTNQILTYINHTCSEENRFAAEVHPDTTVLGHLNTRSFLPFG